MRTKSSAKSKTARNSPSIWHPIFNCRRSWTRSSKSLELFLKSSWCRWCSRHGIPWQGEILDQINIIQSRITEEWFNCIFSFDVFRCILKEATQFPKTTQQLFSISKQQLNGIIRWVKPDWVSCIYTAGMSIKTSTKPSSTSILLPIKDGWMDIFNWATCTSVSLWSIMNNNLHDVLQETYYIRYGVYIINFFFEIFHTLTLKEQKRQKILSAMLNIV